MRKALTKAKPQAWIDEAAKNPSKYMSAQLKKMKQGTLRWGQTLFSVYKLGTLRWGQTLFSVYKLGTLRWGQTLFSVYSQFVAW
jgi:hypothetical protein